LVGRDDARTSRRIGSRGRDRQSYRDGAGRTKATYSRPRRSGRDRRLRQGGGGRTGVVRDPDMKAAIVTGAGKAPIYADFEAPQAAPGEVAIDVTAAALSHVTKARAAG